MKLLGRPPEEANERGPHQCLSVSDDTVLKRWIQALLSGAKQQDKRQWAEMHRKFHLNMRKNFTVKVTEHCNRLPRVVVELSSLEISKSHLDTILRNNLWDDPV